VAYSPLGRGFLGGRFRKLEDLEPNDWRRNHPRFQGGNFERNVAVADGLKGLAEEKGCTPAQLALAWLLHRGKDVIPIPGTSSATRLEENVRAADIELDEAGVNRISDLASSVFGDRYNAAMKSLVNR